jgi:RNA polymerase sigma-70 factor (ECF subfamily)
LSITSLEFEALTDAELISHHNEGFDGALIALLKRRETWLWNVAKKTVRDNSLAEEALQEALVLIWKNAATFRGESQVTSWMYQIVTRAAIDLLRKERIRTHSSLTDLENVDSFGGISTFEDALVDSLLVHGALLDIPPEQATIIKMLDLEGYDLKEVSEILKIPQGTVKSRASRGRVSLKDAILKLVSESGNQSDFSNVIPLGVKNVRKK